MSEEQRIKEEQYIIDLTEIEDKLFDILHEHKIPNDSRLRYAWGAIFSYLEELRSKTEN